MIIQSSKSWYIVVLIWLGARAAPAGAQAAPTACGYERCALSIMPRLTGLDVVRGSGETRVASLAFLWPHDVTAPFASDSAALAHAMSATRIRRTGAAFTVAGLVLSGTGAVNAAFHGGRVHGATAATLLGGLGLIAVSVPIQFAADAQLSRAVWCYNRAFGRTGE